MATRSGRAPAGEQRRWTVLLRWLLLLPQFVVVALLSFAAFFVTIAGWFSALVLGGCPTRSPPSSARSSPIRPG